MAKIKCFIILTIMTTTTPFFSPEKMHTESKDQLSFVNFVKTEYLFLLDTMKDVILPARNDDTQIEKEEISTNKPYLVLVGSFGKLTNAQKMLKRVERKGLNGIIKKIGNLHRVIIASSLNEQDAIDVKNQNKKTFEEVPYVLKQ